MPQSLRTLTSAIANDCTERMENLALEEFSLVGVGIAPSTDLTATVEFMSWSNPGVALEIP